MEKQLKNDRICIQRFVDFLRTTDHPAVQIDEWPEDSGANNQIDAIAGPFAIEHTSIDALPNQREMDARFSAFVGDLEVNTKDQLGYRLWITIPFDSLAKGMNWKAMNAQLVRWVDESATMLCDGYHPNVSIIGIPFPVAIVKGGPILTNGVRVGRSYVEDGTFVGRVKEILDRKLSKLSGHRSRSRKSLLLVESSDLALMTDGIFFDAFDKAYPEWPMALDELWFAHQVSPVEINFSNGRTGRVFTFNWQAIRVARFG